MRNKKKNFIILWMMCVILALCMAPQVSAATKKVIKFEGNYKDTNLKIGKTKSFNVLCESKKVDPTMLKWSSSNKSVAVVNAKGQVTGIKNGKAVITVKMKNNQSNTLSFNVYVYKNAYKREFSNLKVNPFVLNIGQKLTLKPIHSGVSYEKFYSSDPSVVSVDQNGKITAKKKGTATVTYLTIGINYNISKAYVTVGQRVTSIHSNVEENTLRIKTGESYQVNPSVEPANASMKKLNYMIGNTSVATVTSDGLVQGKKRGVTVLTIKGTDGGGKYIRVRVIVSAGSDDNPGSDTGTGGRRVEPKYVAHRGLSSMAPENSLPAIKLAGYYGFDAVECDVRETKDGQLVIIHDANLNRMCGVNKNVSDMTLAEIRQYPIISGVNAAKYKNNLVPTVDEFISACNMYLSTPMIEIKGNLSEVALQRLYASMNKAFRKPIVISFYRSNLKWLRSKNPALELQNVAWTPTEDELNFCRKYKVDISVEYISLNEAIVKKIQAEGMKVSTWTANDRESFMRMKMMGVDYLSTEYDFI